MAYKRRTCYLCGEKYEYCPDCVEFAHLPYFMQTFCSESCKTVFDTCTKHSMNILSKDEAAAILADCDLSKLDDFRKCAHDDVVEIMQEDEKARKRPSAKENKDVEG